MSIGSNRSQHLCWSFRLATTILCPYVSLIFWVRIVFPSRRRSWSPSFHTFHQEQSWYPWLWSFIWWQRSWDYYINHHVVGYTDSSSNFWNILTSFHHGYSLWQYWILQCWAQGRHLRGLGGHRSPRKKKKEKKQRKQRKKRKKEKNERKGTMNNVKLLHIKCCFFSNFSVVRWHWRIKKNSAPQEKVEMTPLVGPTKFINVTGNTSST